TNAALDKHFALVSYLASNMCDAQPQVAVLGTPNIFVKKAGLHDSLPAHYCCRSKHLCFFQKQTFKRHRAVRGAKCHARLARQSCVPQNQSVGIDHVQRRLIPEKSDLLIQIFWKPAIIAVQKSEVFSMRMTDTQIASRTRSSVFLFQVSDS